MLERAERQQPIDRPVAQREPAAVGLQACDTVDLPVAERERAVREVEPDRDPGTVAAREVRAPSDAAAHVDEHGAVCRLEEVERASHALLGRLADVRAKVVFAFVESSIDR